MGLKTKPIEHKPLQGSTLQPVTEYNPYLAARREWDERYGEFVTRARNWRTVAFLTSSIALLSVAGLLWMSARSRVVPFVVLIDSLGRPLASGIAEQAAGVGGSVERAEILKWVEDLRTVTPDGIAQRKAIDRVYAHIASGSHAQTFISEFYRNDPPFKRAQTDIVAVEVNSVLPTSDRTFEVEWLETTRDLYGKVKAADRFKGSFTVAISPPTEERQIRANPLGIYVTQASWAKVL